MLWVAWLNRIAPECIPTPLFADLKGGISTPTLSSQNPPRLAVLFKLRPPLPAPSKQLQRPQEPNHFHRKHIPCVLRHNVGHQRVNLVRPVRSKRVPVRAKAVAAVFTRPVRRLH